LLEQSDLLFQLINLLLEFLQAKGLQLTNSVIQGRSVSQQPLEVVQHAAVVMKTELLALNNTMHAALENHDPETENARGLRGAKWMRHTLPSTEWRRIDSADRSRWCWEWGSVGGMQRNLHD
jgi:hypothetical protein